MNNILLTIEYDGTDYNGWQIQTSKETQCKPRTVQETLEKILEKILQEKVKLTGSGRTDAGVHANGQTANFRTCAKIPLKKLKRSLNSLLPEDIRIKNIKKVDIDFHAQFWVKSKVYRYTILNRPNCSVFTRNYCLHIHKPLDVDLMRRQANTLLGRHDFKSFQAADSKARNSIRTIKKIEIKKRNGFIIIDIEADGFLYKMVRNIIGTLIEIGRKKLGEGSLKKILEITDRRQAGPTIAAKGLCLMKVRY